jgi:hypothetical protein
MVRNANMIKQMAVLICLLAVLVACGCVGTSNSSPPEYIKTVSAIKAGDGQQIYIILADKSGQETTSDGTITITIEDNTRLLYKSSQTVSKTEFQNAKLGMGAFQHDALILSLGRLAYSELLSKPKGLTGKVTITFTTPDKRDLKGDATVFF